MRSWLVASAIVERDEAVLMVRNRRRDGREDWSTPGGVVDEGETPLGGLRREVFEETGLDIVSWAGPAYRVRTTAVGLGWDLTVEVHRARSTIGELSTGADPDGIVVGAEWVRREELARRLVGAPLWVSEPLQAYLADPDAAPATFSFAVEGEHRRDLTVRRLER